MYAYEEKHIQTLSNIKKSRQMEFSAKVTKIEKAPITDVPAEYQADLGCKKLQFVWITYNFFGAVRTCKFDTKILDNGDQIIIGGNGFFKDGTKIN